MSFSFVSFGAVFPVVSNADMQDELLYWIFYDVVQYYNGKLNENKNNTKKKQQQLFLCW